MKKAFLYVLLPALMAFAPQTEATIEQNAADTHEQPLVIWRRNEGVAPGKGQFQYTGYAGGLFRKGSTFTLNVF